MGVLNRHERRRQSAQKHARRPHPCPISGCGKVSYGNGGYTSHKRKHVRAWLNMESMLGLPKKDQEILQSWIRRYAFQIKRLRELRGNDG
jgi:hypothetical protein